MNETSAIPPCPTCRSSYVYSDGVLLQCPECGYAFGLDDLDTAQETKVFQDAFGNRLQDGDSVTVIKDLKVRGAPSVVKVGTKVRNIRLVEGDHDIDCRIDGFGAMQLKSEFVKKA